MSSMCARNGQERPHTRAPLLFIALNKYIARNVHLAQLLRTCGRFAPYGRTVRRTSNGYIDRLKPVRAIRKVKVGRSGT
jgi:hypothetical protein